MKAVVILNGEPPRKARLRELAASCPVFAADGGTEVCVRAGVKPEWVAGDFDSFPLENVPEDWERKLFPEQDRTDFQKVLACLPEEVDAIHVLGGLGRRIDHTLTNLLIASSLPETLQVCFEQGGERVVRITAQAPLHLELPVGHTLSLLPLGEVTQVQTSGLKWNLTGHTMGPGQQLGQSNQVEGPVTVQVGRGSLFAWWET
ncbi:MAG: thiamine diphosphokinase [Kiritimatiellia bacterium]